ncbi:hypothetical protein B5F29_09090 [Lachnoclostridium sp. An196]|uniref:sensor histidine kinase n=1 Tax=Lachnoclostridium sp. An196 TaxID=1965583 RepID=UPI000B54B48A|nr:HAMP domain-containing sensor histidine kinase [Lachnoclostridium sp. An196]OUP19476.1 hypothetical protein B5F29_09090 [Lachnoclostridium sp. An196]
MAIKWKNSSGKGILAVILCAALAAAAMCAVYPYFREKAQKNITEAQESLQESDEHAPVFSADDEFMRYVRSAVYYMNYETTPDMDAYQYFTQRSNTNELTEDEIVSLQDAASRLMRNMRNQYTMVQSMNDYYSYGVSVDREYGTDGNLSDAIYDEGEFVKQYYEAGLVISYDSRGVPSVRDSWNLEMDEAELLYYLQEGTMADLMEDNGLYDGDYYTEDEYTETVYTEEYTEETVATSSEEATVAVDVDPYQGDELLMQIPRPQIQNATFAFGVHTISNYGTGYNDYWIEHQAYEHSGYIVGVLALTVVMIAAALVLQNIPVLGLRRNRLFCLPTEVVACIGVSGFAVSMSVMLTEFGYYTLSSSLTDNLLSAGIGESAVANTATGLIWLSWFCYAFCWYWLAASLLPYLTHPIRTLKERMLCVALWRWLKKQWMRLYHWATDIKLDENLTKNIWKLVGLNGVIVIALCCIWIGGVAGAIIYSAVLYVLIKKKCGEIQDDYRKLLHATSAIADGDLNTPTDEDMGLLNPIRDQLSAIQAGFRKAVDEEVRSRNMKTELITNVSHDLKTPLTAIITYVDLLKKEDLTEEERREYVDTLDRKSQRLKVLIEDLFEVSKATTNNITMNFTDVDLVNLIKQVHLENEDKIAESTLDIRWNLPDEKCILSLDPQRTYRIIDNLLQNCLKYSMPHSRVYIDLKDQDGEVTVTFKNMSAVEMNFSPDEITERFVRGDLSRNTEGSGLGLAIVQSFTELQNGECKVETDGDLFKVTLRWKRA